MFKVFIFFALLALLGLAGTIFEVLIDTRGKLPMCHVVIFIALLALITVVSIII